jgi:cytochrome c oxidase cbb3-type subunit I/II
MLDPESMSPNSIMPPYPWMIEDNLDYSQIANKISVLRKLGTPYPEGFEEEAAADLERQAAKIAESLRNDGIEGEELEKKEIVALIAYLQRLGTDIKPIPQAEK